MQIENNASQILGKIQQELSEIGKIEGGNKMPGSSQEIQFMKDDINKEMKQLDKLLPKEGKARQAFDNLQKHLAEGNVRVSTLHMDVHNVQEALNLGPGGKQPIVGPGGLPPGGITPITPEPKPKKPLGPGGEQKQPLGPGGEQHILGPGGEQKKPLGPGGKPPILGPGGEQKQPLGPGGEQHILGPGGEQKQPLGPGGIQPPAGPYPEPLPGTEEPPTR